MVLEVPNVALGSAGLLRLWARAMAPVHGTVAQIDLAGRPGIVMVFNRTDADRAAFNEAPPATQLERFGARFVAAFRAMGYP